MRLLVRWGVFKDNTLGHYYTHDKIYDLPLLKIKSKTIFHAFDTPFNSSGGYQSVEDKFLFQRVKQNLMFQSYTWRKLVKNKTNQDKLLAHQTLQLRQSPCHKKRRRKDDATNLEQKSNGGKRPIEGPKRWWKDHLKLGGKLVVEIEAGTENSNKC